MSETFEEKTERNIRAQTRYDELMREGKHGHYETMSRVVREEVERERERCAKIADNYASQASTGVMQSTAESMWSEKSGNDIAVAIRGNPTPIPRSGAGAE